MAFDPWRTSGLVPTAIQPAKKLQDVVGIQIELVLMRNRGRIDKRAKELGDADAAMTKARLDKSF